MLPGPAEERHLLTFSSVYSTAEADYSQEMSNLKEAVFDYLINCSK